MKFSGQRPTILIDIDQGGRSNWGRLLDSLNRSQLKQRAAPSFSAIRIEAGKVIGLVQVPAIEPDEAYAKRVIWPGEAPFRAKHQVVKAALAIQTIDKRRVRQISWRNRKQIRNRQSVEG